MMGALRLFVLAIAISCSLWGLSQAAVISIDFGSEWMKIALVKPGVPMKIVLNEESGRKTAAVVSIRNDDRLLGGPALHMAVKHPKTAYRYLQLLVGQKHDSPMVRMYREWFPFYDIRKDEERGTVLFQHDENTVYSPEELVAMLFNNTRQFAEAYAGVPIQDVVITIPTFFNQAQRRTIIHCASLVGLNVLQLMSNSAAAALNYGLIHHGSFNTTPRYVMFYDMGAASTTATIVDYRTVQVKEGTLANVHPQLTVKGQGFSRLLGGLQIDLRLQQHLAKKFEAQHKTSGSVFDSPRAMAKLLKEAQRIKHVLSANLAQFAQIEGLLEEVDFRVKVTREELEELCKDIFLRVGDPVKKALQAADMIMEEIDTVVLVGGGTRVPKVQENLLKAVNKSELGKSLNTDEANALGAIYRGAAHTKFFRVKKFIVKEAVALPIMVSFNRVGQLSSSSLEQEEEPSEEEVIKTVKRTLFQRGNPYPTKKILTFNRHFSDFSFQVLYGDLEFLSEEEKRFVGRINISEIYLAGVGEAFDAHLGGTAKGIKAHFLMDESGVLKITNVESVFEYPQDDGEESTLSKIGNTISSFFGMGSDDSQKKEPSPDEGEEVAADGNMTESETNAETRTEQEMDQEQNASATGRGESDEKDKQNSETDPEPDSESTGEDSKPSRTDSEVHDQRESPGKERKLEEGESMDSHGEDEASEEEENEASEEEENEDKEEELDGSQETPSQGSSDEMADGREEGDDGADGESVPPSGSTNQSDSASTPTNATSSKSAGKAAVPQMSMVKVNLTVEVTMLDLLHPTPSRTALSVEKLAKLQQINDEMMANQLAKNLLESHIYETKAKMLDSEAVKNVSTEEQREEILASLKEMELWLEEDGYIAETKVYKVKLRELKKVSRTLLKRVVESELRPRALQKLMSSLNISIDFLKRMKSLSSDLQIFTEVEVTTLEELVNEVQKWALKKIEEQEATPRHKEPAFLSHEVDDQTKRLDREIMYLLRKLRSHPPPNLNFPTNKTNATESNRTKTSNGTASDDESQGESSSGNTSEGSMPTEAPEEPLELPGADGPTSSPDEEMESPVVEPASESTSSVDDAGNEDDHEEL